MVVLLTCKNEEDPMKNKSVKSANKIQLKCSLLCSQNSNLFEMLWLSSLLASMKKI